MHLAVDPEGLVNPSISVNIASKSISTIVEILAVVGGAPLLLDELYRNGFIVKVSNLLQTPLYIKGQRAKRAHIKPSLTLKLRHLFGFVGEDLEKLGERWDIILGLLSHFLPLFLLLVLLLVLLLLYLLWLLLLLNLYLRLLLLRFLNHFNLWLLNLLSTLLLLIWIKHGPVFHLQLKLDLKLSRCNLWNRRWLLLHHFDQILELLFVEFDWRRVVHLGAEDFLEASHLEGAKCISMNANHRLSSLKPNLHKFRLILPKLLLGLVLAEISLFRFLFIFDHLIGGGEVDILRLLLSKQQR